LTSTLRSWASSYNTADFHAEGVDLQVDLRDMTSIPGASFDLVIASHVLEHIDQDDKAIREIYRIVATGGCAILPVPLLADETVEYPDVSVWEHNHVRAPGIDYFERYREVFDRVDVVTSEGVAQDSQPWLNENRIRFPNRFMPYRPAQAGTRHLDAIPICWKSRPGDGEVQSAQF
jgi:SAM-dependent methyltransferase